MGGPSSIKVTDDAYYALKYLKKIIKERHNRTYSISDLILAGALVLDKLLGNDSTAVVNIAEKAKLLRLKKNRGDYNANIFETLKRDEPEKLCNAQKDECHEIIKRTIEMLINQEYPEAAALILFEYKNLLEDHEFKELASKIVEMQAQILKGEK